MDDIPKFIKPMNYKITTEMNEGLNRRFDEVEVYHALKDMNPSKAPGREGFSRYFYQKFNLSAC